jgi:hypothetical protein
VKEVLSKPDYYIDSTKLEEYTAPIVPRYGAKEDRRSLTFSLGLINLFQWCFYRAANTAYSTCRVDVDVDKTSITIHYDGDPKQVLYNAYLNVAALANKAELCCIFSSRFTLESSCLATKTGSIRTWKNNMSACETINDCMSKYTSFVRLNFEPDSTVLRMNDDTFTMMAHIVYTKALEFKSSRCIRMYLNGKHLK